MNKTVFLTFILVAVAVLVAALLFVRFNPAELSLSESDINLLAQQIVRGDDHVTVQDLADRIIKARDDYLLIDLRSRAEYDEHHIDSAVHMPLTELLRSEALADLPVDRAVIVYSNSTTNAAQAAVILRMSGIPAYSLIGGYNHWSAYMTDPVAAGIAEHDARERARYDAIRCYLEGEYVAAAGLPVKQPEGAGFTPPLEPAGEERHYAEDPLGLGLGLEMATEPAAETTETADPLGLGLGLDIGAGAPSRAGAGPGGRARPRLKIREGC